MADLIPIRKGKWRLVVVVETNHDRLGAAAAELAAVLTDHGFINITIEEATAANNYDG